jgi:hypothetical protein
MALAHSKPRRAPYRALGRQCVSPAKRVRALRADLQVAEQCIALFHRLLRIIRVEIERNVARNAAVKPQLQRIVAKQARHLKNLQVGRAHGSATNKVNAATWRTQARQIAADLRAHPSTKNYTDAQVVAYIRQKGIVKSDRTIREAIKDALCEAPQRTSGQTYAR